MGWENVKNCWKKLQGLILYNSLQFLDVFSALGKLKASQDTSLEYPQRVLWRNIPTPTFKAVLAIFKTISGTFPDLEIQILLLTFVHPRSIHTFLTYYSKDLLQWVDKPYFLEYQNPTWNFWDSKRGGGGHLIGGKH